MRGNRPGPRQGGDESVEFGEEWIWPRRLHYRADKALQHRLVGRIRVAPARPLLPLAHCLDHVSLDALAEAPHALNVTGIEAERPSAEQRLVEEVFDVTTGHDLALHLGASRAGEPQPP